MCSCHSILECCVAFSGVKLSIRSFVLFLQYSVSCLSAVEGLAKPRKLRTLYRLFALGALISPMTQCSPYRFRPQYPSKFSFENFIDKCVSASVDSTIY